MDPRTAWTPPCCSPTRWLPSSLSWVRLRSTFITPRRVSTTGGLGEGEGEGECAIERERVRDCCACKRVFFSNVQKKKLTVETS